MSSAISANHVMLPCGHRKLPKVKGRDPYHLVSVDQQPDECSMAILCCPEDSSSAEYILGVGIDVSF